MSFKHTKTEKQKEKYLKFQQTFKMKIFIYDYHFPFPIKNVLKWMIGKQTDGDEDKTLTRESLLYNRVSQREKINAYKIP